MTIEYKRGNIFTEDAEALVNAVNCVGVMGRGIALQFKQAYPANCKAYEDACRRGDVKPGRMFVFETPREGTACGCGAPYVYIINFPTKRHWKDMSRIEDIESGLLALAAEIRNRGIRSIALPPLGCGLGGLAWSDVRSSIEAALGGLSRVKVVVFEPQ
jgi:O-acetyl-ADP-ribose deacetylase (regulator of RNase III)